MTPLSVTYQIILFLGIVTNIALSLYAWQHRSEQGIRSFIRLLVSGLLVSISVLVFSFAPNDQIARYASNFRYMAALGASIAVLNLALDFSRFNTLARYARWLYFLPVLALLLVSTDPVWHNWWYEYYELSRINGLMIEMRGYNWAYNLLQLGVGYGAVVIAIGLLIYNALNETRRARVRSILLVSTIVASSIVSIFSSHLAPTNFPNTFALFLTPMILLWGYILFRDGVKSVLPIAYRHIFQGIRDAVIVLDTQHIIVDTNPYVKTLPIPNSERLIGSFVAKTFPDQYHIIQNVDSHEETTSEITLGDFIYDCRTIPLFAGESYRGRLILLRDITSQKQVEQEREALIRQLDAYAGMVAHDLRDPLQIIMGYMQLMDMKSDLPPQEKSYLQEMLQAGDRMSVMIQEILVLSRLRKEGDVTINEVDMQDVFDSAIITLAEQIKASGAKIAFPHEPLPYVLGHNAWLVHVVSNLISNAIKYGGKPPHVTVQVETKADCIRFVVADNGRGVDAKHQDNIFNPFVRVNEDRLDSHGIGLTIVREIITKLSGQVGLESTSEQGSRFYFELPKSITEKSPQNHNLASV